ncbi:MarR family winged helix-turn-helix transcriptional regulator [Lentzea sp. NPDC059081]|uniref:MarR family winged helix-turn-helix transcriptional regulator n=1 Tax=Lentzea sp. NPDC059081 TaxID=3346719 RepID=UPI00368B3375
MRATREHADALAPPLAQTLGLLDRDGDLSTATLAQRRGVRHQSQSRTVKDLEVTGLIARRDDPEDGRGFLVTLTEQGRAALDRDRVARRDWIAQAIETVLDQEERARLGALADLLDRLSGHDGGRR